MLRIHICYFIHILFYILFCNIIALQNIDGEAFLMLTQEDLVSVLCLRLGPAIKLYNSIVLLRQKAS